MGYKKIIPKHPGANSSNMTMVGIGVDDPTTNLDVLGDVRIRDSQGLFFKRHGDDYAWRMRNESSADGTTNGFNNSNDLVFAVVTNSGVITGSGSPPPSATSHTVYGNSANTLVLKETGNVGIGTTTPTAKLVVEKGSHGNYLYVGGSSEQNRGIMFSSDVGSSGPAYLGAKHTIHVQSGGGEILFKNDTYDWLYLAPDGNVGIGTASPGKLLTLSRATEAQNEQLEFRNAGGISNGNFDGIKWTQGATGGTMLAEQRINYYSTGVVDMSFNLRNEDNVLYLKAGGNVGIGTSSPFYKIDGGFVNQTWGWYLNTSYNSGFTYNTTERSLLIHTKSSENIDHIKFATGGAATERMRINSSGIDVTGTVTSDGLNIDGHIIPGTTDAYDIGSASNVIRNIYTGDLHLSNESKSEGNKVDGTKGNWTMQEGEEHLYIINNKNGKKYKFALEEIQ